MEGDSKSDDKNRLISERTYRFVLPADVNDLLIHGRDETILRHDLDGVGGRGEHLKERSKK